MRVSVRAGVHALKVIESLNSSQREGGGGGGTKGSITGSSVMSPVISVQTGRDLF